MLLYRTVLAGDRAYRQGLVIDSRKLVAWLADNALGKEAGEPRPGADPPPAEEGRRPRAGRRPSSATGSPSPSLRRSPWSRSKAKAAARLRSARQLSALLLAAVLLGLFAVYRMAAYAVAYAQRRSDFVAAVTHELKTPLTAIRMYGEMLRDDMVAEESEKRSITRPSSPRGKGCPGWSTTCSSWPGSKEEKNAEKPPPATPARFCRKR